MNAVTSLLNPSFFISLVDRSDDFVAILDEAGAIRYLNSAGRRMLGIAIDASLEGRSILEGWTDKESVDAMKLALAAKASIRYEGRLTHTVSGEPVQLDGTVFPLAGDEPSEPAIAVVLRDVSVERKTVDALRSGDERLRATYDRVQVGISEAGFDGIIHEVNPRFCEILGRSREEILGHHFAEFSVAEDAEAQIALHRQMLEGELTSYTAVKRYVRPNGEYEWAEMTVSAVHDSSGRPATIIGFALDISEHRRLTRELEYSEQKLQLAVEAANVGIWDSSVDLRDQTWSDLTRVHLGAPPLPADVPDLFESYVHSEDVAMIYSAIQKSAVDRVPFEFEFRTHGYDGRNRWILCRGRVVFGEDDQPERVFGVSLDVTVQRRAEMALRDLLERKVAERTEQLETANKDLESFCYTVSHDLRAPLRAIIATGTVLMREFGDSLDVAGLDLLQRHIAAANKMGVLIDDLLHLSRLGRQELAIVDIDLSSLCEDILSEIAPEGAECQIERGISVRGDVRLIRVACQNLLQNALKFVGEGQTPRLEVRRCPDGSIEFRDQGIGFEMKYADRIFLPFERLVSDAEFPGTGCGLANVRKVAERLGGSVRAISQPGKGSSFFLKLNAPVE
jgi:PAS domain S-box-containing protein